MSKSLPSPRELEVGILMCSRPDLGNKGIAALLNLSEKTVEKHRQRLYDKTGVHSLAELLVHFLRNGIIQLRDIRLSYDRNPTNPSPSRT